MRTPLADDESFAFFRAVAIALPVGALLWGGLIALAVAWR